MTTSIQTYPAGSAPGTGVSWALSRLSKVLSSLQAGIRHLLLGLIMAWGCVWGSAHAATYYIDYNAGLDTNAGTSKTAPWKRHPYMPGWTGGNKYTHMAGDRFIFKGGVVWPAASFPMTVVAGGTPSSYDYYGADTTWYAGTSFTRPIFDGQGKADGIVSILNPSNVQIDNIEMRDVVFNSNEGVGLITIGYTPKNIKITNVYLHKWTLSTAIRTDDAHGGVIVNNGNVPPVGIIVDGSVISNTEYASTRNNGVAIRNVQTVSNSEIFDMPTAILYAGDVHGNHIYRINYPKGDFDPNYHTNLIYMAAQSTNPPVSYVYNNRIHDIGSGTGIYLEPCFYSINGPATMYAYNNIVYNSYMGGGGIFLVDSEGGNGACGKVYIYQNTLQLPDNAQIGMIRAVQNHGGTNRIDTLVTQSNHYIGPNQEWDTTFAAKPSSSGHVVMSNKAAAAAGYTVENMYKPVSSSAATVNKGSVIVCATCNALNRDFDGTSRGLGGAWDVGAHELPAAVGGLAPPQNLVVQNP